MNYCGVFSENASFKTYSVRQIEQANMLIMILPVSCSVDASEVTRIYGFHIVQLCHSDCMFSLILIWEIMAKTRMFGVYTHAHFITCMQASKSGGHREIKPLRVAGQSDQSQVHVQSICKSLLQEHTEIGVIA